MFFVTKLHLKVDFIPLLVVFSPQDHCSSALMIHNNTSLLGECRLAPRCNPLCHFNPALSDVVPPVAPPLLVLSPPVVSPATPSAPLITTA